MKKRTRLGFAGLLTIGIAALGTTLTGAATATDAKEAPKAKIGEKAPDFTLTCYDGKEHSLSELTKSGKIVVLEWFAYACPFVIKHYSDTENSTVNKLVEEFKNDDVVFLAINSANPSHSYSNREQNIEHHSKWKMAHPILVDSDGRVGRMYEARTTPHMYIIDKDGVLKYAGALDNDRSARSIGETNYVRQALREILAGESVTVSETRP
ncbi:MAG: redoxin domain-containing protein, partial [Phycisphaerales bacterium]